MRGLLLLLVLVVASSSLASDWGGGDWGAGGGGSFSGGTLSSPLLLDNANTTCATALALAWEGDANLGLQRNAADIMLVCLNGAEALRLTSTTMTSTMGMVFSGVATPDVDTALGEDLVIRAGGASGGGGAVGLWSRSGSYNLFTTSGAAGNRIDSTATIGSYLAQTIFHGGTVGARAANVVAAQLGDNAAQFSVYGDGLRASTVRSIVITSPTDTATEASSTHCTMSSTGAAAWTPGEATNVAEGMEVRCINTGTDAITMTASAGVYVGTCVVGQNDVVEFVRVSGVWIETDCKNN